MGKHASVEDFYGSLSTPEAKKYQTCMFFFLSLDLLCHHLPHVSVLSSVCSLHQFHLLSKAICKIRKWYLDQTFQNSRNFLGFL